MPQREMDHANDQRQALKEQIGNIDDIEIFNNQILVAVYIRPEKTKGGIIMTDRAREEDKYQGKIGLIVKMGSQQIDGSIRTKLNTLAHAMKG